LANGGGSGSIAVVPEPTTWKIASSIVLAFTIRDLLRLTLAWWRWAPGTGAQIDDAEQNHLEALRTRSGWLSSGLDVVWHVESARALAQSALEKPRDR